ncbi:hypothetical protein KC222_13090 [Cedecea davisae]|uniref:Uncharacterized protein n=1 Tax=Cedecea davisae TaxID=158484 RepID=A0ABS6DIA4_9ENTR|nr:YiiX/YebB-like N1pC/P60 family cysteine hydrolase [Cedecea davisae]MBU4682940.1 hypothetical protein [Cedecea davisae]MBU4687961.1 hypothetical protein [Cedecea davisae]
MCIYLIGLPGDLIFTSPPKKNFNVFSQSLLRFKKARYSHVAISVEQYIAIQAMPKDGVMLDSIRNILNDAEGGFSVYRYLPIQDNHILTELKHELLSYSRQSYNFAIFFRSPWHSSFCSELATRAFRSVGIQISNRPPQNTLPIDIYKHVAASTNWVDITKDYKNSYLSDSYSKAYDTAAQIVISLEYRNQDMAFGQQQLLDRINSLSKNSEQPTNHQPTRHYWTNHLEKKFSLTIYLKYKFSQLFSLIIHLKNIITKQIRKIVKKRM